MLAGPFLLCADQSRGTPTAATEVILGQLTTSHPAMESFWSTLTNIFTGEFMLYRRRNGGAIVLMRAVWTTIIVFVAAIGIHDFLRPEALFAFSRSRLVERVHEHFAWLGAMFAGVYTVYYSRFASQWNYMAGLYNQIMAVQVSAPLERADTRKMLSKWWAAFLTDAHELHLSGKRLYATVIATKLGDDDVVAEFNLDGGSDTAEMEAMKTAVIRTLGMREFERLVDRGARITQSFRELTPTSSTSVPPAANTQSSAEQRGDRRG